MGCILGPVASVAPDPGAVVRKILVTPRVGIDSRRRGQKLQLHWLCGRKKKRWAEIIEQLVEAKHSRLSGL